MVSSMIPKKIHRVIPDKTKTTKLMDICWEASKFYNQDYEHITHDDNDVYEEINSLLLEDIPGAIKADIIRYFVLYSFGGIYIDSDFETYRSFDPLLNNSCFAAYEVQNILGQAVMGCEKGNTLMLDGLNILSYVIKNKLMDNNHMVYDKPFNRLIAPGPYSITKAMLLEESVTKLQSKAFYPFIPWDINKPYSEEFKNDPEIYGIHWFVKSWGPRSWTLPRHIEEYNKTIK